MGHRMVCIPGTSSALLKRFCCVAQKGKSLYDVGSHKLQQMNVYCKETTYIKSFVMSDWVGEGRVWTYIVSVCVWGYHCATSNEAVVAMT